MTPILLATGLVLLLGATAVTMRRADHPPRHALGASDDLLGWAETLAAIRADLQTIQAASVATADTVQIELIRWVPPEVVTEWMEPGFLFTHRHPEELLDG